MTALTENQIQIFAEKLQAQRADLIDDILMRMREQEGFRANYLEDELNDSGDQSVANQLVQMSLDYVRRETELLQDVQEAELRMHRGTYGICIECGEDINPDRLQLQPAASRCFGCQEAFEKNHDTHELGLL